MKWNLASASLIVAGVVSLVAGGMANFVSLPRNCGMTALDIVMGLPDTDGLWLISMALWLAPLILLVTRSVERIQKIDPASRRRWLIPRLLLVLGWGLLGSWLPYYWLSSPTDSLTCDPVDRLPAFNLLGGAAALLLGICLTFAFALRDDASQSEDQS